MSKITKVWLKSNHGRPFIRAGARLNPQTYVEVELDAAQLASLKREVELPGNVLDVLYSAPAGAPAQDEAPKPPPAPPAAPPKAAPAK